MTTKTEVRYEVLQMCADEQLPWMLVTSEGEAIKHAKRYNRDTNSNRFRAVKITTETLEEK
jgi:hypothetical protein